MTVEDDEWEEAFEQFQKDLMANPVMKQMLEVFEKAYDEMSWEEKQALEKRIRDITQDKGS